MLSFILVGILCFAIAYCVNEMIAKHAAEHMGMGGDKESNAAELFPICLILFLGYPMFMIMIYLYISSIGIRH